MSLGEYKKSAKVPCNEQFVLINMDICAIRAFFLLLRVYIRAFLFNPVPFLPPMARLSSCANRGTDGMDSVLEDSDDNKYHFASRDAQCR